MHRVAAKSLAINQATWIWLIIWIIFYNLAIKHGKIYLIKYKIITLRFFISMIGNTYPACPNSTYYVIDIHSISLPK